ncbi:MAG: 2-dehydropantoate 2-reductase [Thermodesulforhabdaceae bacterium]
MKIFIIGTGAIGGLLGARFIEAGEEVYFCDIKPSLVEQLLSQGIVVREINGQERTFFPKGAYVDPVYLKDPCDIFIFTVKSYATRVAAERAVLSPALSHETLILTLQNGLGNPEILENIFGSERLIVGTTAQGATLLEPGVIRHGGTGPTFIGPWKQENTAIVEPVVDMFNKAGLEAYVRNDVKTLIWEKLLVNVGINAITALTGILNEGVYRFKPASELSRQAVREAVGVAKKLGIPVRDDIEDHVLKVAQSTGRNRSSMGQDVDRKHRTEIDAINGAIVNLGQEYGISTPVNWTLVQLVKTLELGYGAGE